MQFNLLIPLLPQLARVTLSTFNAVIVKHSFQIESKYSVYVYLELIAFDDELNIKGCSHFMLLGCVYINLLRSPQLKRLFNQFKPVTVAD